MIISANFNLRISSKTRICISVVEISHFTKNIARNNYEFLPRNRFKHTQDSVNNIQEFPFRIFFVILWNANDNNYKVSERERVWAKEKYNRKKIDRIPNCVNTIQLCNLPDNARTRSNMYIQRMVFLQTLMIFSDTVRVAVTPLMFSATSSVSVIVLHLVNCSVDLWKGRFAKKSDL